MSKIGPVKIHLGIVLFAIAACSSGGDSGIDKSKKLNSLSPSEVTTFCQWAIAAQGGTGHQTMCGDLIVKVQTQVQCESKYGTVASTCTATVGDAETCNHALTADPCSLGGDACQVLFACSAGTAAFAPFSSP